MLETFAPKDIEGLSKLAGLLAIPFFAAAVYVDFGLWVLERDPQLSWLATSSLAWLSIPAKVVAFFLGVFGVAILFELVRLAFSNFPRFYFFVGFSLLAFGVLGLGGLLPQATPTGLNVFWHLGCLCWGLDIFGVHREIDP
ncbi:MAG: hypothetical protein HYZ31_04745 [Gammaproteobacteria bacterium]|nr:hypothetical protein [Gammaproteobacteria bacterium]